MKFSVIIPVWNAEKTIESCLDSIFSQTSVPDEIIVIDGGSHDATLSIVEKYLRPEDYVYTEPDNGPYDAMNKGVAKAQGEIVAILNADDYWMPGTCETVREAVVETGTHRRCHTWLCRSGGIFAASATSLFRFTFVECVSTYFKSGNDIRRCQVKQAIDHGFEKAAVQLEVDTQRYPASL